MKIIQNFCKIFDLVFVNSSSITISINETAANGTGILNLTITDRDFDTILAFGILSGNTKNNGKIQWAV